MPFTTNIHIHEITRGTRLAITLKNGSRIAGKATGRPKTTRHMSNEIGIRPLTGKGIRHYDTNDIASIIAL
ncbi:hypothetical protein SAMN06265360_10641 [Haloechinothrix alba]|uniref:Uncharacterized protein n=1 Tax=Haloechinothrix alba TaxID=664784 RepID=A0A238WCP1_9PSEU|nr:hypothetical protein [Haloechinothrix alba]SNR44332.1 hypothetical protein SAMN06265360_10641 [Haloechinothrix alba]